MRRSLPAVLMALGVGCVPDPEIQVPDFSVPPTAPDMAPMAPRDMAMAGDMAAPSAWRGEPSGTMDSLRAVAADATLTTVYIVGDNGTVLRRTQAGVYEKEASGTTANLYGVVALDADEAWAVGARGTILHRKANRWTQEVLIGLVPDLFGVAFGPGGDGYAVGDDGAIYRFSGGMWKGETSGSAADLRAVWAGMTEAFAVGTMGTVLRRAMDKWAPDSAPLPMADRRNLYAIVSLDGTLFAAGEYGTVLRRQMAGWTAEPTVKPPMMMGQPPDFFGLWAGGGELWAVGSAGAVQRRSAMGTYSEDKSGATVNLFDIAGGDARSLLVVGDRGTILRRQ